LRNKQFFTNTLKANYNAYTETKKKKKSEFVRDLVRYLRSTGSRFLTVNDNDEWVEIGDVKANKKFHNALMRFIEGEEVEVEVEVEEEVIMSIIGRMDDVEITERDILIGKKATDDNLRNKQFFTNTLKANYNAYTETKKKKKSEFVRDLVRYLRSTGSRFLTVNDNDEWVEIGDVKANKKFHNALMRFIEGEEVEVEEVIMS